MKWGGYGPSKARTVALDAETHDRLLRAAYAACGEGEHVEAKMAAIVAEAFRLWEARDAAVTLRARNNATLRAMGCGHVADADEARHPEFVQRTDAKVPHDTPRVETWAAANVARQVVATEPPALACDGSEECGCGECRGG